MQDIQKLLNDNRGKIGFVQFKKKDGSLRSMSFRQAVRNGSTPLKGGQWANGNAGKAKDHGLALVSDLAKEKAGEHSRRSFKLSSVTYLAIGGVKIGEKRD